jgi:hypothetical protein
VAQERFPLLFTQRRVLPLAVAVALAGAWLAEGAWARAVCLALAVAALAAAWLQARTRPTLILDEDGYAVEERGREKLRVPWSEVKSVRADPSEHALYVDCGDPRRNLLVPPRRGFGFRFERAEALYAFVVAQVPERVEVVARLDTPKAPEKGPT